MMNRFFNFVFIFLLSLLISNCGKNNSNKSTTYTLKFGHLANENHVWHKAALKFAELVRQKSNGRIEVKVYPNEQLGKELDMITGILAGTVDMTITGESLQNWAPKVAMCAVPYLIRDSEHLAKVAGGEIGKEIEEEMIDKIGLRPIAWFERGARNLTSNRPIRHPDDLKGIILRVPNVPLFVKAWSALGAKPTPMAFSEVFTSLQQGTIEAQENPYALIYSAGFYEVQKYINLTEHVIGWIYVVIGEKQFQALPTDLQQVILEAGKEMQDYEHQLFLEDQKRLIKELKAKGMQFIEVDKEAFMERAKDAVFNSLTPEQRDLYLRIEAIK